jgi:hypothetical protein
LRKQQELCDLGETYLNLPGHELHDQQWTSMDINNYVCFT